MVSSTDFWCMLVGSYLQCSGASAIWFVNHWWHLTSSTLISVWPCCTPGPVYPGVPAHDALSDGGYLRRQKGRLEKTAGSPSQRLAQQDSGGCQRSTAAIYAVEIWDRQRSRSGATVHSDYVTTTMMMKDDLCQKWRVKLIFQGT